MCAWNVSSTTTANTIDASPRGPNQAMNATVGARAWVPHSEIATGSIRTTRQAQHGVERDLPAHVLERRAQEHRSEDEERDRVEDCTGLLRERLIPATFSRATAPNTMPATNAAMNPEPPRPIAIPVRERGGGDGDDLPPGIVDEAPSSGDEYRRIQCGQHSGGDAAPEARSQSPRRPRARDVQRAPVHRAVARTISSNGTQIPSFRPLSTFNDWRTRWGRRESVTTELPSPASVGARITPRIRASLSESEAKRASAVASAPARSSAAGRCRATARATRRSCRRPSC